MNDTSSAAVPHLSWLRRQVPAFGWLRGYQSGWLRADLVAGVTLAAYLIPAGLGDATLAGLPPAWPGPGLSDQRRHVAIAGQ